MSADNWTKCPKCSNEDEIHKKYGKIPLKEFNLLLESVNTKDILREDYEIGIYDGTFSVSYHAQCTKCDYEFSFKTEKKATKYRNTVDRCDFCGDVGCSGGCAGH
jgi:hypothetical protein